MIKWLSIPDETKRRAYNQIAENTGMSAFGAEKDWWVVQTLSALFETSIKDHLVFKGGTSLSKAWKLIERFSEDIDLAIGREFFGFNGVLTTTQSKILRKTAGKYIDTTLLHELEHRFAEKGIIEAGMKLELEAVGDSDRDRVIYLHYPNVIEPPGYLLPPIKIEIGCRSLMEPCTIQTFASLLDEIYPASEFVQAPVSIPTVNPERTFLEKVFLLHEEFQRPVEKMRVKRLSRHLYDIVKLAKAGYMDKAIQNPELYQTIVEHRQKFNKVNGVEYNLHAPKSINPIPPDNVLNAWKVDYNTMFEQMIYEQKPPSFEQILDEITLIKNKINALPWELKFDFLPPNL
jgi:predicted nucleotidyltransferase component of viral defense system